jgi:hypothetical protein
VTTRYKATRAMIFSSAAAAATATSTCPATATT